MADAPVSPWNSLEAAKLLVGLLTPLVLAFMGFAIQQQLAYQERVVGLRVEAYERFGAELNRIFCFVQDVGTFKEDNPESVVGYKRTADAAMYAYQAIWPEDTFQAYEDYMSSAFALGAGGYGTDALIRTDATEKRHVSGWLEEWDSRLTGEKDPEHRNEHRKRYESLIKLISRDLVRGRRRKMVKKHWAVVR